MYKRYFLVFILMFMAFFLVGYECVKNVEIKSINAPTEPVLEQVDNCGIFERKCFCSNGECWKER